MNQTNTIHPFTPSFWLQTVFLVSLWALAFYPVYPELWNTWMHNDNNSHGVLVPLIAAYLIWAKKDKLKAVTLGSSKVGGFILIGSLLLYLLALAGQIAVVQRVMIVSTLAGLILYNYGTQAFSVLAFPVLYLIFMVPIPISVYSLIAFPLQLFATDISYFLIQLVNIPVLQQGNMLYFANAQLEVAEACSGLRSMMTFVMLSVLFAYMMDKGLWQRILLIGSAIPLAIIANILRITGTGILSHYYGEQVAMGFMHEFSGIVVFVFGFVLISIEYALLNKTT